MRFACITETPITLSGGSTYILKVISGIVDECESLGISCDVFSGVKGHLKEHRNDIRYDGYLFWAIHDPCPYFDTLAKERPSVRILTPTKRRDANAVLVDSKSALHAIMDHLAEEGFKRIGFFNTINLPWAYERFTAYKAYADEHTMAIKPSWMYGYTAAGRYALSPNDWKYPERHAAAFCSGRDRPEAVVCANDGLAYHIVRYAIENGIQIPRDLAVTGFDDRAAPDAPDMRVTTARTDFSMIGRLSSRLLFEILSGVRSAKGNVIRHRPDIIIRTSSMRRSYNEAMNIGADFRDRIYALVYERYREPKLSEALSAACGYSHDYFLIKFAKTFGMPFTRFINRLRIDKAKALLGGTKKAVTEIVYESGFHHLQNFYRAFQREVGCAPKDYRNRLVR
ncbi:MAG: substrate-binding domain-containing protein [Spirochaetes bacterium]|nr:substrate-binding domain-containing protein [Spirochaetota bacterium]